MRLSRRSGLVGLGSVAAPVAAFLFVKVVIGVGPSASPAQTPDDLPAVAGTTGPTAAVTPEQKRALAWLATLKLDADMPSPLEQPEAEAVPETVQQPVAAPDPLDGVRLSTILETSQGVWATINGKTYRQGDVAEGYTLRSIDVRGRRIELVGPDGQARWIERKP